MASPIPALVAGLLPRFQNLVSSLMITRALGSDLSTLPRRGDEHRIRFA
jgi:hypothetical protein